MKIVYFFLLVLSPNFVQAIVLKSKFIKLVENFEMTMTPFSMEQSGLPVKVVVNWNLPIRPLAEGGNGGARFLKTRKHVGAMILASVAQDPAINSEAIAFILCHELGHALNDDSVIPTGRTEDAADHFAIKKCMPFLRTSTDSILSGARSSMIFLFHQFNLLQPNFYFGIDHTLKPKGNVLSATSPDFVKCRYQRLVFWATGKSTGLSKACSAGEFSY